MESETIDFIQIPYPTAEYKCWGVIMGGATYVIVLETENGEYTASFQEAHNQTTIFLLDQNNGVKTIEEAKLVCLQHLRKRLS